MKHTDYEFLGVLSIIEGIIGFIFIGLGVWKGFFTSLGIILIVISFVQLYIILFNKDK